MSKARQAQDAGRANLQIVNGDVIPGEVQHAVEQRTSVTVGQNEPVTVVLQTI